MKKIVSAAISLLLFSGIFLGTAPMAASVEQPKAPVEETLADCYSPSLDLALAPVVVTRINTAADLVALKKTERAATAIFAVDEDMYITAANGASVGFRPADIYEDYFKGRVIPAFYVKDMAVAEAVGEYLDYTLNLLDMEIVSASAEVITYLRERNPKIRAVMDYSQKAVGAENCDDVIFASNRAGAHAVILSAASAVYETVYYIQARNKTAWTVAEGEFETARALSSGAYGIVTDNVPEAYDVLEKASKDGFLLNRAPYNVAHRGLAVKHYENSIEAFDAAYRAGATHIELDVQLTKDNAIVVMHDATIDKVTNGSGRVADYNLEELKKFRIIKNCNNEVLGEGVEIPTLEEVFEHFEDTDLLYVLEVKAGSAVFSEKLKALLDKCDMRNRMFIISFNEAQLDLLRAQLPEISLCSLNDLTIKNFARQLRRMAEKNISFDVTYGNSADGKLYKMLKDRGFMVWTWTYGSYSDLTAGMKSGATGLTNDAADSIKGYAKRAFIDAEYVVSDSFAEETEVGFIDYEGTRSKKLVKGSAVAVEEHGDYAYVIYKARFDSGDGTVYYLLTDPVRCVLRAAYISPEEIAHILSKRAETLTAEEISLLDRMENAYELLSESEKISIDYGKIAELKEAVSALPGDSQDSGERDSQGESVKPGCGSSLAAGTVAAVLFAAGLACALCAIDHRRRKRKG